MVNYKNATTKVTIVCKKASHIFEQQPRNHLTGYGCSKCQQLSMTKTQEKFVNDSVAVHGDTYDYSKVDYKNNETKVSIICRKGGHEFRQSPTSHLRGSGCPKCSLSKYKSQNRWLDIIGLSQEYRNTSITLPNGKLIKLDGYDPVTNTIYEFHGDYWHGNPERFDPKDINKNNKKTFGELYQNTINREKMIM